MGYNYGYNDKVWVMILPLEKERSGTPERGDRREQAPLLPSFGGAGGAKMPFLK